MASKKTPQIPLPKSWTKHVRSAMLHVLSLAQYAAVHTRSWAVDSLNGRVRLKAENDRLNQEVELLREEMRIKDTRMASIPAQRRPHYSPVERLAILELRAARGWTKQQTAERFLVTAATIASWMNRVDEEGPDGRWARRKGIKPPRYGAVGKHGSIAIVERMIRTLKDECTRRILVPLQRDAFRRELVSFAHWNNEHRPHMTLEGRTPNEQYCDRKPANRKPRIEPRPRWPRRSRCARPQTLVAGKPGDRFDLHVDFQAERKHLPVVRLLRVA